MVAISPSGAEVAGLIPARGARIPHALRSKKKKTKTINNRSHLLTNSIKALKMVRITKKEIFKKKEEKKKKAAGC